MLLTSYFVNFVLFQEAKPTHKFSVGSLSCIQNLYFLYLLFQWNLIFFFFFGVDMAYTVCLPTVYVWGKKRSCLTPHFPVYKYCVSMSYCPYMLMSWVSFLFIFHITRKKMYVTFHPIPLSVVIIILPPFFPPVFFSIQSCVSHFIVSGLIFAHFL